MADVARSPERPGVGSRTKPVAPPVTWERDSVHFPEPLKPLAQSFGTVPAEQGSAIGFARWSLPVESFRLEAFDGYIYSRMEPFGGEPPKLLRRAMQLLPQLAHAWRLDPAVRRRILAFDKFVADGGFENSIDLWQDEWEPEASRRLSTLRALDLEAASDDELAAHLDALYEYIVWAWSVHANVHFVSFYVRGRFFEACRRLLGLERSAAQALLAGADPALQESSDALADLADEVRGEPAVMPAFQRPGTSAFEAVDEASLRHRLDAYLEAHGDRPLDGFDITRPRLRERPEIAANLLRDLILQPRAPGSGETRAQDEAALRSRLSGAELAEFDHWLGLGRRAYPLNESHEHLLTDVPESLARYAVLEAGRRLADADRIETGDDVFFLFKSELTAALTGPADVRHLVSRRRADFHRQLQLTPPAVLGPPPEPPPLHALPRHAAQAMGLLLEQYAAMEASEDAVPEGVASGGDVAGIPGSPGEAVGPVRVVRSIDDIASVQRGDVLVCPLTTPAWTVLFPMVSAIVTDTGGALSHAAIVAREYGTPAVVGTRDATQRLKNGAFVRVNGTRGLVTPASSAETAALRVPARRDPPPHNPGRISTDEPRDGAAAVAGPPVVTLDDPAATAVALTGGKGARLAQLRAARFNVPDGFVVTTAWDGDEALVRAAAIQLEEQPVAVRSSGTTEDLGDASFAGQYETYLDVRGPDAVVDAIARCRSSLASERVAAYQRGGDEQARMAVVVQRMAPHDVAGVAFTADPVTGDRTRIVVEGAVGLGEQIVGGEVIPDRWTVARDTFGVTATAASPAGPPLPEDAIRELASIVIDIERLYGDAPQDVEWSYGQGRFHILQARPITTLDR